MYTSTDFSPFNRTCKKQFGMTGFVELVKIYLTALMVDYFAIYDG